MMDEQRVREYGRVIQELLGCPVGEQEAVLERNREWVDGGLMMFIADRVDDLPQDTEEQISTVQWFKEIALKLAPYADFAHWLEDMAPVLVHYEEMRKPLPSLEEGGHLSFFLALLQIGEKFRENKEPILEYLSQNIQYLNLGLVPVIEDWVGNFLLQHPDNSISLVRTLGYIFNIIADCSLGNQANNQEIGIAGYQLILQKTNPHQSQKLWSTIMVNLAISYYQRIYGNRAENIEIAIDFYKKSLKVTTKKDFPIEWAETMNNLSSAYRERIKGNRSKNIETAISYYQDALTVVTQAEFPLEFAKTTMELATTYKDRIKGNRSDNIEEAIAAYSVVSKIYQHYEISELWAMAQYHLSLIYQERIKGNKAENIEKAILYCDYSLQIYTYDDFPKEWAITQCALASALSERIKGNKSQNIEEAISAIILSLKVLAYESCPEEWALAQNCLAIAYRKRIQGNQAENIEKAIAAYSLALKFFTRKDFPKDWAMIQNNLGIAYSERINGDRAENIEQAISAYSLALEVISDQHHSDQWALAQNNLATAYSQRIRGDRAENIEQAITAYSRALKFFTCKDFPQDWAMIQQNIGLTYSLRIYGDRAKNIEYAITAYSLALQVYTHEHFPEQWAITQNNLANAYRNLIRADNDQNIEQAIATYKLVLQIYTRENFPQDWAATQNNLANAYRDLIQGDRDENIEQAIAIYKLVLQIYTRKDFPQEWATTQGNLAAAYENRIRGDQVDNLERAITTYRLALEIYTCKNFPNDCRRIARLLANLYADNHRWTEALAPYETALQAAENLYSASLFRSSQEAELKQTDDLYRRAAYAHAKTGNLSRALELIEQGRARGLSETLQRDRANLDQIQHQNPDLVERYRTAANTLRNLESIERHFSSNHYQVNHDQLREQFITARSNLSKYIDDIRQIQGCDQLFLFPDFNELIENISNDYIIIHIIVTSIGGAALYLKFNSSRDASLNQQVVWLNDLTDKCMEEMVEGWLEAQEKYKSAYFDYKRTNTPDTKAALLQVAHTWHQTIDTTTRQLWDLVMGPIIEHLNDYEPEDNKSKIVLIPSSYLSLFPLHAAWLPDLTTATGRYYALDAYTFTYIPNVRSLVTSPPAVLLPSLLAIDNPVSDLLNSSQEVASAAQHFPKTQLLSQEKATRSVVLASIPNHTILHFSCHGTADLAEPLNSGLLMADGLLTLRDFFSLQLQKPRLAILSACETSLPGIDLPDEVISLPVGLLQAGVPAIIASLWSVSDLSTMLLLTRFYELWRTDGHPPAQALRQAQRWLRDSHPNYAHPYHWAAFTYTGV